SGRRSAPYLRRHHAPLAFALAHRPPIAQVEARRDPGAPAAQFCCAFSPLAFHCPGFLSLRSQAWGALDRNSVRRRGLRILFRLIFSSAAFGDVWGNLRERSLPKDPPDRCRHLATK
ncbi:hypothetical protein E2I00_000691, partial [Balaenoptera physalus]